MYTARDKGICCNEETSVPIENLIRSLDVFCGLLRDLTGLIRHMNELKQSALEELRYLQFTKLPEEI